jgi:pimeloyl-ACP methyl ester carboxylesterase
VGHPEEELASRQIMLKAVTNSVAMGHDERAAVALIDWAQRGNDGFGQLPPSVRTNLLANAKTMGPTFSERPTQVTCDQLRQLRVPTLVVNGEHTRLFYRLIGSTVASCVPGAKSVIISNTGHMTIVEDPAQNARVIKEFLQKN